MSYYIERLTGEVRQTTARVPSASERFAVIVDRQRATEAEAIRLANARTVSA